jgi:alpha-1,6-mannosyltransferase
MNLWILFFAGAILRLATMFVIPALSDDFYRFLWDGYLFASGESPYVVTPDVWLSFHPETSEELRFLLANMNSREYISVYPLPVQFLFSIPWRLGMDTLLSQVACLQVLLFLIELGNLYILLRQKLAPCLYWLYVGNPILIFESSSQIHIETILLFLFLCLLANDNRTKAIRKSFLYSILLQIKMSMLFLMPAIFLAREKKGKLIFVLFVLASVLILFLTIFENIQSQMLNGLGLFFHSFRFHSLGEQIVYLCLSPFPSALYLSGFVSLACGQLLLIYILIRFRLPVANSVLIGMLMFLLFSPVVHPWYILPFVGLAIYFDYHVFLAIMFTCFAALSYLLYGIKFSFFPEILGLLELSLLGIYLWKTKPSSFLQKIPS